MRTAATQDRSHTDPQVAARGHSYTKAAPVGHARLCRSKLCLRTAAALNHNHAKPQVMARGHSYKSSARANQTHHARPL